MSQSVFSRTGLGVLATLMVMSLASCGGIGRFGASAPVRAVPTETREDRNERQNTLLYGSEDRAQLFGPGGQSIRERRASIWDLFRGNQDAELSTNVNRYLWQASLDVLNFLPVETVDPFSGVIATGFGTPPGGGRAYRATVYISDPSLDARSLRLAMQQRGGGAVSPQVVRQIEDAILTRARELRVRDSRI
jgi:hypothetical protein